MNIKDTIRSIFTKYISELIPQNQTNVFWQLFNGIDSGLSHLETMMRISKRERNLTTAQNIQSLRTLASNNGFEPMLRVPSKGTVSIEINQKLFNEYGYPLYLPAYAQFKNKRTGMMYYYDSSKSLIIRNGKHIIPLVEGELKTQTHTCKEIYSNINNNTAPSREIERVYIDNNNIAHDSIAIAGYTKVSSFFDNNYDKMFLVKFSTKPNSPLVLYVMGATRDEILEIVYRLTFGVSGNIDYNAEFETEDIIDSRGLEVETSDLVEIKNTSAFNMGSNGSDINTLRSAIGFNHGVTLLFDSTSYRNFIMRYSTLLLQDIKIDKASNNQINDIYISKRVYLQSNIVNEYTKAINKKLYIVPATDLQTLTTEIERNEFATSSHNIFQALTNKFAFQFMLSNSVNNKELIEYELREIMYGEFAKFLYDNKHVLNVETIVNDYMKEKSITIDYIIFNQQNEMNKIQSKSFIKASSVIDSSSYLPLLDAEFDINTRDGAMKMFTVINFVYK